MKRIFPTLLIALSSAVTMAAQPDAVTQKEVEHLIGYLASSGCRFNRNGTWYDAPRAAPHLRQKYEYLLDRNLVKTAESFIDNAASESSVSGKPYLVQCEGKPEVQSSAWFRAELARFRGRPS
jgi:hypothetical protein